MSAGMVVCFETEEELSRALELLQPASKARVQTYTPKAPDGLLEKSGVPIAVLIAGLLGVSGMFAMEALANVVAYPLDIGGRPQFSWPSFVPIAFEIGVLCAMLAGFFGYLVAARMPRIYDPVDECESLRRSMRDEWVVAIHTSDPQALERVRKILDGLHPKLNGEMPT